MTIEEATRQPNLAIIEKGEKMSWLSKKKKDYFESLGIKCDWYYYPEDIKDWRLFAEIRDLEEFYDGIYIQDGTPQISKKNIQEHLPKRILDDWAELENKNVLVIGSASNWVKELYGRAAAVSWCKENRMWDFIPKADLIITNVGINCYPIHVPIIDLTIGECINTEDREVHSKLENGGIFDQAIIKLILEGN